MKIKNLPVENQHGCAKKRILVGCTENGKRIKNLPVENQHGCAKKRILVGCTENGDRVVYTEKATSQVNFKALKALSEPNRSECFKKLEQLQTAQAEKQKQNQSQSLTLKEQAAKAAAHRRKQALAAKEKQAAKAKEMEKSNTSVAKSVAKSSWERRGAACPGSKMGSNTKKARKKGGAKKKQ